MEKRIKENFMYNTLYQIVKFVFPLLLTPYLARTIGPKNLGTYSYVTAIVSYFVLVTEFGTTYYAQKEISAHRLEQTCVNDIFYNIFFLEFAWQ